MLATGGDAQRDGDGAPRGGTADGDLLDALVREHRDAAVAYACRILGDPHLAEDAVQRAFLQILLRVRSGDADLLAPNPRAVVLRGTRWAALKIADRHLSRDEAERRAAGEAALGEEAEDWDRLEARMLVADILPSLPVHYRDVLRLRYLEGQPDARAAQRLEVTVKAYRRRLDRALVVARTAAVRIGVSTLGAGLVVAAGRLRDALRRATVAAARVGWGHVETVMSPTRLSAGHVAVTLAVVSLVVGSPLVHGPSPRGDRGLPQTGGSLPADGSGVATASGNTPVAAGGGPNVLERAAVAAAARTRDGASATPFESADDVAVSRVVVPAGYDKNHTVVAEGTGQSCRCAVVMQSTDGGATWQVAHAPGTQLLLPPDYPRDPRIVYLYDLSASVPWMACVADHFGAPGCTALAPVPSSQAVLDPRFDLGSPVLYYVGPAGLMAYDFRTGATTPVTVEPGNVGAVQTIAAGTASGPYAVYTLSRGQYAPGDVDTSPTSAAPVTGSTHVVGCTSGGVSCHTLAVSSNPFASLSVDRDDPAARGFALAATLQMAVSRDAGATLEVVSAPSGSQFGAVQMLGPASTPVVWTVMENLSGTTSALAVRRPGTPGWEQVDAGGQVATFAALTADRLLVARRGQPGLWCSADAGQTWSSACPPQR